MKLQSIKLTNYIGLYNGIGKKEVYLDFSNTLPIVTIEGPNGSGKTTILSSLHPFPDANEKFIPGETSIKDMVYLKDGNIYEISIVSLAANGKRSNKALIKKNGVHLNPNGNVTEYKDIIASEFELDSNFLALSQLSSEDKGLADKRPAERKRFVNELLADMSAYNNIYKALTKRSTFMKGTLNNLTDKINRVGGQNPQSINAKISELNSSIANVEDDIQDLNRKIGGLELIITKNNDDYTKYGKLKEAQSRLIEKMKTYKFSINEDMTATTQQANKNAESLIESKAMYDQKLKTAMSELEIHNSEIAKLDEDLAKANTEILAITGLPVDQLEDSFKAFLSGEENSENVKAKIESLKASLKHIKPDNTSVNINLWNVFMATVNDINSRLAEYTASLSVFEIDLDEAENQFNSLIREQKLKIEALYEDLRKIESRTPRDIDLDMKEYPEDCKNRTDCPYVVKFNKLNEIINEVVEDNAKIENIKQLIKDYETNFENNCNLVVVTKLFNKLVDVAREASKLFGITIPSANRPIWYAGELRDQLFSVKEDINTLEAIRAAEKTYTAGLETYYKYKSQADRLEQLTRSIKENEERKAQLIIIRDHISRDIDVYNQNLQEIGNSLTAVRAVQQEAAEYVKLQEQYNQFLREIQSYEELVKSQNETKGLIDDLRKQLYSKTILSKHLTAERDAANHTLMMLNEYLAEYDQYTKEYSKIETIRKYASPTTGIQTLFMTIYMNKILVTANKLLALMFGGNFVLQPFVINETEFRIPCSGSGYLNDDITSMSLSQRSMIGMIINFAMMFSSSNAYNIIRLDEIDSGLDTENRLYFVQVLIQVMQIMNCEQCFMVSHNIELDESMITKINTSML